MRIGGTEAARLDMLNGLPNHVGKVNFPAFFQITLIGFENRSENFEQEAQPFGIDMGFGLLPQLRPFQIGLFEQLQKVREQYGKLGDFAILL